MAADNIESDGKSIYLRFPNNLGQYDALDFQPDDFKPSPDVPDNSDKAPEKPSLMEYSVEDQRLRTWQKANQISGQNFKFFLLLIPKTIVFQNY